MKQNYVYFYIFPRGRLPPAPTRMDELWSLKHYSASSPPPPQLKTSSYATVHVHVHIKALKRSKYFFFWVNSNHISSHLSHVISILLAPPLVVLGDSFNKGTQRHACTHMYAHSPSHLPTPPPTPTFIPLPPHTCTQRLHTYHTKYLHTL